MRTIRLLEVGVAAATLLSVGLIAAMLAAPWLPNASPARLVERAATPSVTPSASGDAGAPPIGLYLLRGPFSFGPCLALELAPESYPVAEGAEGTATVLTWQRGMTGCDARSTDLRSIGATVVRVMSEGADPRVVGYAVRFRMPLDGAAETAVEITILAAQSTPTLVQALDTSAEGSQGLVFDRVPAVDPTLNPLPSSSAAA